MRFRFVEMLCGELGEVPTCYRGEDKVKNMNSG